MPAKGPVITMVFTEKLLKRLEDFRFDNRIPTRSGAIRRLLEEALRKYEKKPKKQP